MPRRRCPRLLTAAALSACVVAAAESTKRVGPPRFRAVAADGVLALLARRTGNATLVLAAQPWHGAARQLEAELVDVAADLDAAGVEAVRLSPDAAKVLQPRFGATTDLPSVRLLLNGAAYTYKGAWRGDALARAVVEVVRLPPEDVPFRRLRTAAEVAAFVDDDLTDVACVVLDGCKSGYKSKRLSCTAERKVAETLAKGFLLAPHVSFGVADDGELFHQLGWGRESDKVGLVCFRRGIPGAVATRVTSASDEDDDDYDDDDDDDDDDDGEVGVPSRKLSKFLNENTLPLVRELWRASVMEQADTDPLTEALKRQEGAHFLLLLQRTTQPRGSELAVASNALLSSLEEAAALAPAGCLCVDSETKRTPGEPAACPYSSIDVSNTTRGPLSCAWMEIPHNSLQMPLYGVSSSPAAVILDPSADGPFVLVDGGVPPRGDVLLERINAYWSGEQARTLRSEPPELEIRFNASLAALGARRVGRTSALRLHEMVGSGGPPLVVLQTSPAFAPCQRMGPVLDAVVVELLDSGVEFQARTIDCVQNDCWLPHAQPEGGAGSSSKGQVNDLPRLAVYPRGRACEPTIYNGAIDGTDVIKFLRHELKRPGCGPLSRWSIT